MDKVMDQIWKDHTFAFTKHLFVYNLVFGLEFLKQIQVHYDMNLDLKMFTEKLQTLAST